jgi:hypothetical protein
MAMAEPAVMGILAEGVFTVGTRTHVEATIDTYNGDADPISGEVKSGYDASTDEHVRYAFDVVASEVPESAGAQFDTGVFREVVYGYGSISQDGSERVATLQLEASSEDAATDMSDIMQGALTLLEQQIEASETEDTEEIMAALEATEVSADATTTAVTHTRPASEFAAVATPLLLSFVLPQGMTRTTSGSSAETVPAAPQAAFEFQFYGGSGDQNQVAISRAATRSPPRSSSFAGPGSSATMRQIWTSPARGRGRRRTATSPRATSSTSASRVTASSAWSGSPRARTRAPPWQSSPVRTPDRSSLPLLCRPRGDRRHPKFEGVVN